MLNGSIFQKTFLSYLLIVMIPILAFSAIGVYRNVKAEQLRLYDSQMADARRTSDIMDTKLIDLQNAGSMLSQESWVRKRMERSDVFDREFDALSMIKLNKDLKNLFSSLKIVSFGAIVYPEKKLVLSQWGSYSEQDFFSEVAVFGKNTQQNLLDGARSYAYFDVGEPLTLSLWGNEKRVIPVRQSLEVAGKPRATLLLFIDSSYLATYLKEFGVINSGEFTVTADDAVVYRHTAELAAGGSRSGKPYKVELPSQASSWKYTLLYYDDSLVGLKRWFGSLFTLLLAMLVGAILAYGLARVSYRPLAALLGKLSEIGRDNTDAEPVRIGSEYNQIERKFRRLLNENQSLQQAAAEFESAARSTLLLRLLKGYFTDERQSLLLRKSGIGYTEEMYYGTMLLRFDDIGEATGLDGLWQLELGVIIAAERVFEQHGLHYQLFEVTDADKAIIVSFTQPPEDSTLLLRIAAELADLIERHCRKRPEIRHGTVEKGLIGISKSYYAVSESMQRALFRREHVPGQQEEPVLADNRYYYPTDWEVQLINNLKIGNLDTSMRILGEIKEENERRSLPPASGQRLVTLLMETMLRVLSEMNIDSGLYAKQFRSRAESGDTGEMWSYLFEVSTVICERIQYSNTPSAMEIGSKLLDYVNRNFTESDVSLKTLAAMIGMSVSSVSKTFKEVAGVNFYDYLSRLRMERAKELLRESGCDMEQIASTVGYENVYSFKRAFARYEGIKPAEYVQKYDGAG
ncbi:AraC family transcriptional regulator [Paenibacillus pasadenensis]|uniref:helix-turn-helix domain-containing protein n=1 Tax=Paenibacillus pasadenensis TaxID=217090 RepID=UPI00203E14B7|nr:AraC family transcriptional regulator [Paenibacillus pasadenensis]MCM3750002.1 AraC family transcriptional regulator [Paenibacillus pasadenensis]